MASTSRYTSAAVERRMSADAIVSKTFFFSSPLVFKSQTKVYIERKEKILSSGFTILLLPSARVFQAHEHDMQLGVWTYLVEEPRCRAVFHYVSSSCECIATAGPDEDDSTNKVRMNGTYTN